MTEEKREQLGRERSRSTKYRKGAEHEDDDVCCRVQPLLGDEVV